MPQIIVLDLSSCILRCGETASRFVIVWCVAKRFRMPRNWGHDLFSSCIVPSMPPLPYCRDTAFQHFRRCRSAHLRPNWTDGCCIAAASIFIKPILNSRGDRRLSQCPLVLAQVTVPRNRATTKNPAHEMRNAFARVPGGFIASVSATGQTRAQSMHPVHSGLRIRSFW